MTTRSGVSADILTGADLTRLASTVPTVVDGADGLDALQDYLGSLVGVHAPPPVPLVAASDRVESLLVAAVLKAAGHGPRMVTAVAERAGADAPVVTAARATARALGVDHVIVPVSDAVLAERAPTFAAGVGTSALDAIRSAVVLDACLTAAGGPGSQLWTGSGADALWGGGQLPPAAATGEALDRWVIARRQELLAGGWTPVVLDTLAALHDCRIVPVFRQRAAAVLAASFRGRLVISATEDKLPLRHLAVRLGVPERFAFARGGDLDSDGLLARANALAVTRMPALTGTGRLDDARRHAAAAYWLAAETDRARRADAARQADHARWLAATGRRAAAARAWEAASAALDPQDPLTRELHRLWRTEAAEAGAPD